MEERKPQVRARRWDLAVALGLGPRRRGHGRERPAAARPLRIALRSLDVATSACTVHGIHGVLEIHGPSPPSTPPDQLVSLSRIDCGLVFDEGLLRFRLRGDGTLDLAEATWSFAGGKLRTSGYIDPTAPEQTLILHAEDVDLARLLALTRLDGLAGEGRVRGALPAQRREGGLSIRNGRLAAAGPGPVRAARARAFRQPRRDPVAGAAPGGRLEKADISIVIQLLVAHAHDLHARGDTAGGWMIEDGLWIPGARRGNGSCREVDAWLVGAGSEVLRARRERKSWMRTGPSCTGFASAETSIGCPPSRASRKTSTD